MHYSKGSVGQNLRQGMEGTASPQLDIFKAGGAKMPSRLIHSHSGWYWLLAARPWVTHGAFFCRLAWASSQHGGCIRERESWRERARTCCINLHNSAFLGALKSPSATLLFPKWVIQANGEWGGIQLCLLGEEVRRIGGHCQVTPSVLRYEK